MLLRIDEEVFSTDDHHPVFVLLGMVADGRHEWFPSSDEALAAWEFVAQNAPHTKGYRELTRKAVEAAGYPAPVMAGPVRVTVDALRDVVADLSQAAVVIVENSKNDGGFVQALAAAFGYRKLVLAFKENWLIVDHAGGAPSVPDRAAETTARFRILIRVAVLLDSDRDSPGQHGPGHDKRDKLLAKYRLAGVHVWEWKEVENYLPAWVWLSYWPLAAEKLDALRDLPPRQRGYLDIKRGGWKDRVIRAEVPPRVRQLWKDGLDKRSPLLPVEIRLDRTDFEELGLDAMAEIEEFLTLLDRIR